MKTLLLIAVLLGLAIATSAQQLSTNMMLRTHVRLDSLEAIHELLLAAKSRIPILSDYSSDCFGRKGQVILYPANADSNLLIHLQLFTHPMPFLDDAPYPITIVGYTNEYDIRGSVDPGLMTNGDFQQIIKQVFKE